MHRRLLMLSSALIALAFHFGLAPTPAHASGGQIANFFIAPDGKIARNHPTSTTADTDIFLNEDPTFALGFVAQQGQEWAEDIHGTAFGPIVGFGVGFVGTAADSFDVTVTMYTWASDAAAPGPPFLGPWVFRVAFNTIGIGVSFGAGPVVGPDLWMGVSFSDPSVGMWLHDVPQVGTSHDLYWNLATGLQESFVGGPVANFVTRVTLDLPTPVEPTTWGRVKSQY